MLWIITISFESFANFQNNQKILIKPLHKKCTMMTSVIQKLFSLFPQPTMIGTVKRQQEISMEDS